MSDQLSESLHDHQPVYAAGVTPDGAPGAMILVHGRGATAQDILSVVPEIGAEALACLAPQAAGHTWYPFSFLRSLSDNQPSLDSALRTLDRLLHQMEDAGIPAARTIFLGFSQGACLASEFVVRNARRYGGLIAFSGGLIGPDGTPRDYQGILAGTPVFVGCSNIDPHIPEARVLETAEVLQRLGANVDLRIYPGMDHTINQDELLAARAIVEQLIAESRAPQR